VHGGVRNYSPSIFRHHVAEMVRDRIQYEGLDRAAARALWSEINADVFAEADYEETARSAVEAFNHSGLRFSDTWEWDLRDYTWPFLWSCCAIRWGIAQYRAATPVASLAGAL